MLFKFLSFACAPRSSRAKRKESLANPPISPSRPAKAFRFPSHSYPAACLSAVLVHAVGCSGEGLESRAQSGVLGLNAARFLRAVDNLAVRSGSSAARMPVLALSNQECSLHGYARIARDSSPSPEQPHGCGFWCIDERQQYELDGWKERNAVQLREQGERRAGWPPNRVARMLSVQLRWAGGTARGDCGCDRDKRSAMCGRRSWRWADADLADNWDPR
jgi:hypothetical protein